MSRMTLLVGIFLIGVLLAACAPKVTPAEKPVAPEDLTQKTQVSGKSAPGGWEGEWEKVVRAARKEGTLNYYAGLAGASILRERAGMFKEKFGFDLYITTGRTAEIQAKIEQERRNGLFIADLMTSGPNSGLKFKNEGWLIPMKPVLILPEVVNQELWYGGKMEWVDIEEQYIPLFANYPSHTIFINTNLVKPGEIRSYYDLLDPKWKGKIIMDDPTMDGAAQTAFQGLLYNKAVDLDFFRQLVANSPMITRDKRLLMEWLARGKYSISWGGSTSRLSEFIHAGAPVMPVEEIKEGNLGGSGGSAIGIMNRGPNPNAAKIFANWYLSREGQDLIQRTVLKQSARIDISTEGIPSYLQRKPGVKYFPKPNESEEWILKYGDEYDRLAREVFAPLLK